MEGGHKLFPVFYQVWIWFWLHTRCNINKSRPELYVKDITIPALFIWGTEDVYCLPEKSKELFAKCGSENKQIAWFEGAEHSHVRLFDENKYDTLVKAFLGAIR